MSEKENQSTEAVETPVTDSAPMSSTPPANNPDAAGLNVGDLKKMVQIIQTCSKRGAFNADELEIVGLTTTFYSVLVVVDVKLTTHTHAFLIGLVYEVVTLDVRYSVSEQTEAQCIYYSSFTCTVT